MAETLSGGCVRSASRSSASTRPCASASAAASAGSGTTPANTLSSASATGISAMTLVFCAVEFDRCDCRRRGALPLPIGERVGVRGQVTLDKLLPPHPRLRRDLSPQGRGGASCEALRLPYAALISSAARENG